MIYTRLPSSRANAEVAEPTDQDWICHIKRRSLVPSASGLAVTKDREFTYHGSKDLGLTYI